MREQPEEADLPHTEWKCSECDAMNSCLDAECQFCDGVSDDDEPLDPGQRGPCPGHEWEYTGTQYGGDDESYHGEGRVYCIHCGADGDA